MRRLLSIVTLLCLLGDTGLAGDDGGTTSPFSFGTGPRELAMAGSVLAESDAASAAFWNPSRLAKAEKLSVVGLHSRLYFSGSVYQYLGVAVPTLDQGGFGLGIFRQGINGIEKRDDANQLIGETEDNNIRVHLAHGRSWSGYDLGLALTAEYRSLDGLSATSSPGLDLSAGRRFPVNRRWLRSIAAAVNVRNLLRPGIKLADTKYWYKTEFRAGVALAVHPTSTDDHRILLSSSLSETQSTSTKLSAGLEYTFLNILSARGGAEGNKLSVGLGLQYGAIGFDYAMVDRDFGSIHLVSLTTYFGRSKSERIAERVQRREAEFRGKMNSFFTQRNTDIMEELVESGKRHLDAANFSDAVSDLDRALFLARSSEVDTVAILNMVTRAREELERTSRQSRFNVFLDSAQACSSRGDYIATKYFAGQALMVEPKSAAAQGLLTHASQSLMASTTKEEIIVRKLAKVDSLLDGEQYDLAFSVLKSLEETVPGHEGVLLRSTRLDYALLKQRINDPTYYAGQFGDGIQTQSGIDSVALRHNRDTLPTHGDGAATKGSSGRVSEEQLSPQLRREVDAAYGSAKQYFEKGQLDEAVALWEQVDRLAPGYKSVREYLVKAYTFVGANLYAQKRREEALTVWSKVTRLDPGNTEVQGYIKRTRTEISKLKALSYDE